MRGRSGNSDQKQIIGIGEEVLNVGTRMGQTTQMSQDLLRQGAEQQQRFTIDVVGNWMEHNARVMQITMRLAQEGFRPLVDRSSARFEDQRNGR
jgi:hypothetical protein